ncbi:predicted protein [Meyerozyma guilliermondii ATCC 6260]|uniref:Uncharacterized protein n=1 Tax=Meyerozyma guilliermondii (strain ATCC 6260 / CBS 566 / DSM 6381 / JCM 1539 / NBRC 10279 / NRRL Y-324) TaxID=294746 RepID=A5DKV5_PICGU|nr:uncharacterized protein PGUG_03906 [Meyerozyma guilliermondii ATCC 6260]EDK39809.2 predicted protein [Meyerozyma guilliermondii ATCC 6260]
MSTPTMHESTPPQEVGESNPLQSEGMTPQQAVEWLSQLERELNPLQLEGITPQQMVERFRQLREENRQRNEEYRQLREENRQLREVIGRGVFTPRMDEQPSRPMEEMDIGTTPEAKPKTSKNSCSTSFPLLFARVVSTVIILIVAVELPEAKAFRKISTKCSYSLESICGYLTLQRALGAFASYRRKDPVKELLWSILTLSLSAPVHYIAYECFSRQENPTISKCLVLSSIIIASGISPDTAEFVNVRTFCALCGGGFSWTVGQLTEWAEKFIRWARN